MIIHLGYSMCPRCSGLEAEGLTICGLDLKCWGPRFKTPGEKKRITLNQEEATCKNCLRCSLPHKTKITRYKNSCPPLGHVCILELRNPYGQILATAKAEDKGEVRYLRMAKKKLDQHPRANCIRVGEWIKDFRHHDQVN